MILAVARLAQSPPAPGAKFADVARVTGLAPADVRTRLTGPLPRVLQIELDPDRARTKAAALEALGFIVLTCDPRSVPGDDDRLLARTMKLGSSGLEVTDDLGQSEDIAGMSLTLIQKGVRIETKTEVTKKSERRLDLTRALLTGGLLLTKKVETKSTRTTTSRDGFLLLHRGDAGRDVMIYERRLDYRFLGADLQPSSTANFDRLIARLRAMAPRAPFDDRVSRPGFVSGLPSTPAPPVDLALWLVQLAYMRKAF